MVEAVIFDCFGTLVDVEKGAYFANRSTGAYDLLRRDRPDLPYEEFQVVWTEEFQALEHKASQTRDEFSMFDLVDGVQNRLGTAQEDLALVEAYLGEWTLGLKPVEGLPEMIDRLSATRKLAIISNTNYHELIAETLEIAGLNTEDFDSIVTSIGFGKRKPDPTIMHKVLSELGVSPDQAVMVGDGFVEDLGLAQAVGMRCLLIGDYPDLDNSATLVQSRSINSVLEIEQNV